MIYIKYLPKDKLLHYLWKGARFAPHIENNSHLIKSPSIKKIKKDLYYLSGDFSNRKITLYHGKYLFINPLEDYINTELYNFHNGNGKAEEIINGLKKDEIEKVILRFFVGS